MMRTCIKTEMQNAWQTHTCTQKHSCTVVQCSSSFQNNIIRQQRSFRVVWSHTGFTAMGNKIKKAIFLQLWPKKTNFSLCARRERDGQTIIKAMTSYQVSRGMHGPSALICLLCFFCCFFCAQCDTHHFMCAFIQRNSMSACFQPGWLQQYLRLQP